MEDTAFYIVSGGETALNSQYIIGNIPRLLDNQIIASILLGLTIAALLCKLNLILAQKYSVWEHLSSLKRNLIITILFFVVFEALLHLPYYSPSKLFIPDPLTFWKANPEATINERGRRTNMVGASRPAISGIFDQEYTHHKDNHTFRIAVLGDSQAISAFRHQYAPKHCYPKVLQNNLRLRQAKAIGNRQIEIIDGAISGYSSWQGLMLYKSDIAPYKPDMVIEAFGYHDANEAFSTDRSVITDSKWLHYLRSWMYRSRLCLLVRSFVLRLHSSSIYSRKSGDIHATERVPLSEFIENIESFRQLSQKDGFQLVILLEPTNRHIANSSQLPIYYEALRQLAYKYHIPIIDAPRAFDALPPQQYDRLFADSIHFTPEGHRFMAKLIEEALIQNNILEN
ncbi:MAG: SGNH/GDSL hydrolase family protein [Candidatus Bruticola sp.]